MSPEGQAFVLQLHSAWRDWVADGSKGANAGSSWRLDRDGRSVWMCVITVLLVGIFV